MHIISVDRKESSLSKLAGVVDMIDSEAFLSRWANLVRELCGAEFISAYRICNGQAKVIVSNSVERPDLALEHSLRYAAGMHWRHDPVLALARTYCEKDSAPLIRVDPRQIDSSTLKREFYRPASICDKLAIIARKGSSIFVVSLLNTFANGRFDDAAVERITEQADVLIGLLAKHSELTGNTVIENMLANVSSIEARLLRAEEADPIWRLTPRERQVCARILFGLTAAGIAIDLGINEYSVDTYRKRSYLRLGLATRHELLRHYLSLDASPVPGIEPPVPPDFRVEKHSSSVQNR
ncbi:hypothetical protein IFT91_24365 [Pseudomonas fluorescens]|nr:hypothetical protein [Pseudomonas fluorescens]